MATARWEKGAITERPTFGVGNSLINVYDIPVTIPETGDTFIVSIPVNQFTVERAREEIQTRADMLMELHNLGG